RGDTPYIGIEAEVFAGVVGVKARVNQVKAGAAEGALGAELDETAGDRHRLTWGKPQERQPVRSAGVGLRIARSHATWSHHLEAQELPAEVHVAGLFTAISERDGDRGAQLRCGVG